MGNSYWVQWSGSIRDSDGGVVDPTALRKFLISVTSKFATHADLDQPAVTTYGGLVMLSGAVTAPDDGEALNKARRAFGSCIIAAGGSSDLPDGEHESWTARELKSMPALLTVKSEVSVLQLAA
jgi:hypothetical protein